MKKAINRIVLLMLLPWLGPQALAQAEEVTSVHERAICAPDGVALGGYDVVSYHQADGPKGGLAGITVNHGGLIYQFSSAENQTAFTTNPERYLPTYMGWCSTNLAMGRLACPDFSNFKIENGKLLLFEHAGFTNGRDIWNTNPETHKQQADQNFKRFGG
ncbi:MAG: YHS domain-containing (seleno)protein [Pseudomonadota bacterium]